MINLKHKIWSVCVLLTVCTPQLYGQTLPYFNHQFDTAGFPEIGYNIVQIDSSYVVCGQSVFGQTDYRISIIELSDSGIILNRRAYGDSYHQYYPGWGGSFIPTSDSGYALGGCVVDTAQHVVGLLMKFDMNFDTIWTRTYGGDSIYSFYQCKQLPDNGYILCGYTDEDDYWGDFFLLRTDSLGNELWRHNYGGNNVEYGMSVIATPDGGFLIGGQTNSFGGDVDQFVVKVDSSGNQQWQKVLGGIYDDVPACVMLLSDGNYLVGGIMAYSQPGGPGMGIAAGKPYLVKLDNAGNIIWEYDYGSINFYTAVTTLRELPNGDIVAAGFTIPTTRVNGLVLKVNSMGDSLWYRTYSYDSLSDNYIYDIRATSDNGLVTSGFNFQNNQNIWVMKLDSLGCDTMGCNLTGVPEPSSDYQIISVFPNPASEIVTLQFSDAHQSRSIIIYDQIGREVWREETNEKLVSISVSEFSTGMYFYRVEEKGIVKTTGKLIIE